MKIPQKILSFLLAISVILPGLPLVYADDVPPSEDEPVVLQNVGDGMKMGTREEVIEYLNQQEVNDDGDPLIGRFASIDPWESLSEICDRKRVRRMADERQGKFCENFKTLVEKF